MILEGAEAGKGKHEFISDNEDMNAKIIGLLNDAITPFLTDISLNFDHESVEMCVPAPESISIVRKNEPFETFIFFNDKLAEKKKLPIILTYFDSTLNKQIAHTLEVDTS